MPLVKDLERRSFISHQEFQRYYLRPRRPVVLTDMMDSWPALRKWSFQYFADLTVNSPVCIEYGNVLQGITSFSTVQFQEYIRSISNYLDTSSGRIKIYPRMVPYLSLFDIFGALPALKADVDFSLLARYRLANELVGWIGPPGTVTGLHSDRQDNLFAQIVGHKLLYLIAPEQRGSVYPSDKYDPGATLSSIDIDHWDSDRYPLFCNLVMHQAELSPGEMVFIPRGWWHYVQALEASISVSNFGVDIRGLICDTIPDAVRMLLHHLDLYAPACTCHVTVQGKRVGRRGD
jgi:hypothetical protein